jgi:hypothetical protein
LRIRAGLMEYHHSCWAGQAPCYTSQHMKLQIDNLDGGGVHDYTPAVDCSRLPQIRRRLNQAATLKFSLVANSRDFVAPVSGARVTLGRINVADMFAGYVTGPPEFEYLGWGYGGPVYRYNFVAQSDELLLQRRRLPGHSPFVGRSAGDALRQLTTDLLPGAFDLSGVQNLDLLPAYLPDPQKTWAQHAALIGILARAAYRALAGALSFAPVGATVHSLNESDAGFSPEGLKLTPADAVVNDVTVVGLAEPQAYVKNYFVGDGVTLRFYLSQQPFVRTSQTILNEEYEGAALDSTQWSETDPASAISVSGGKLQVAGGTGTDGQTTVMFSEKIELGGAFVLQHGDVVFDTPSDGVLGGLYAGGVTAGGCLAGFWVTGNGSQSDIQAVITGVRTGPVLTTVAGHHYVLSTRFYATEIFRKQQMFHSSGHPAGSGRGGADIAADVRLVLEVHDIDPANPATLVAASQVLFDGTLSGVPGLCNYAPVNAANMHCSIAFTRLIQAVDAEVRSALPGASYRTRLVGSLADGAECLVTASEALQFFSAYVPAANELIEVKYRGSGRATARVTNPASIAALAQGSDDGVRSVLRRVKEPAPRTAADCENAALALLDDHGGTGWAGEYQVWSDFLPGGQDVFPGDAMSVNAASRGAALQAVVREVDIEVKDPSGEHCSYAIRFADDACQPLGFEFETSGLATVPDVSAVTADSVGSNFLPELTGAEIIEVTSTSLAVDVGVVPPAGGGIEVRRTDLGWGPDNDRNLAGRFTTQTFTLDRLARTQGYFLRPFDGSTPPKYSRYSVALYVDYPL